MNLILLANIITCAGALVGFVVGAIRFFRPRAAVYAQMITLACGVIAFSRLYQIIRLITIAENTKRFHLGVLGVIGSLLFLFAANFGLMDSLVDDGSKELRRYRLISLAAPAVPVAVYSIIYFLTDQPLYVKVISGIIFFMIAQASYYNLKHFIIPDVDFGIIRSLRQYNLLALVYEFFCLSEIIMQISSFEIGTFVIGALTGIVLPLLIFAVIRGVRKWST